MFLWALPVSERSLNMNISLTSRHLTSWCNLGTYFPTGNIILGKLRNGSFLDRVSVPREFLDYLYCVHNNSHGVESNDPLCLWNWDVPFFPCGHAKRQDSHFFHQPRSKCSCSYYSNSIAVFNLPLVGDLVFKRNPEPVTNSTPRTASTLRNNNIHGNKSVLSSCNSLTVC